VQELYNQSIQHFGKVDAVINNAAIAVLVKVVDVPIEKWDKSYHVNLRGPVLMACTFLPDMLSRGHGAFASVSSTGTAFLGGYETFKAAQVYLANTLDAELEGTGVIAYTIGSGLVPTQTASDAVVQLAPQMGLSVKEYYELNKNALLIVEEAGAGDGIGYEAAGALLWLGANVIIAEINNVSGANAAETLGNRYGAQRVLFFHN
jgi:NAD(P)-dependent dehydrogenase (short-subunit alcohol dehydrogenase family)